MPDEKAIYEFSHAHVAEYYALVTRAFAFLPDKKYKCRLRAQELESIDFYPDTHALVAYVGEHVEVDVRWDFPEARVYVSFLELRVPRVRANAFSPFDKDAGKARAMHLDEVAHVLGHADDPDFLLGDPNAIGGRDITRRFKLLQTNFSGALEGLARATERYGAKILKGDKTLFSEVDAHREELRKARGY
ncbi:MAG TPA: hypothetical protein VFU60_17145 [Ktedonobacterales bacterium]|nr:hypothetical protein [Ktedonobacterales bacterium]